MFADWNRHLLICKSAVHSRYTNMSFFSLYIIIWQTLWLLNMFNIFFFYSLGLVRPNFSNCFQAELRQFTPHPLSLACKFPIGGTFREFKVFHAFSRAKSTFWEYLLQVNIISCGNLKNLWEKLRHNNRCKSVSRKLSRLNIINVDRTTLVPKGECPKFFYLFQVH